MSKNLFLLTESYPFGKGEEFIENEILFLSENFDQIYIISENSKCEQTKLVPQNCFIYRTKNNFFTKMLFLVYINNIILVLKALKLYGFNGGNNLKKIVHYQYKSFLIQLKIKEIFRKKNIVSNKCIFYSYWFYHGAHAISSIKSKYRNIKTITRAHRFDLYDYCGIQPFKDKDIEFLDHIVCCSKEGRDYLIEKFNEYKDRIDYCYLGTLNEEDFKLTRNNFKIVSCSYFRPVKRVELIMEALSLLGENKNIEWIHIGDGEYREEIESLAKQKLGINFKFLGHLENKEVLNFYSNNDIKCFINLSESEGLPVSMMEAQSYGIPIIATDVGGVKEIVSNKNGYLLSSNPTPQEVLVAIEKILMCKEDEYELLQKNSYLNWKKYFNANINYKFFINNYLK